MAIQAALALPNDKAYLFTPDGKYDRYNSTTGGFEATDDVVANWSGLPGAPHAAVYWGSRKAYFFGSTDFYRYDLATDRVDAGYPKPIAGNWTGLWPDGFDTVVNWGSGKLFFFKGSEYIRYDISTDRADDGYPKQISAAWDGIWTDGIDAVLYQGGLKAYFFKGDQWREYDVDSDHVTASGAIGTPAFAATVAASLAPARSLSDATANGLVVDLIHRGQFSIDHPGAPRPGERLRIRPTTVGGISYVSAGAPHATVIDNVDQRMAVVLHRLTRWLNAGDPTISEIVHMGIGHGNGPDNDCHNQGRAIDFAGVNGTLNGTDFTRRIARDWGHLPGTGVRLTSADPLTQSLFGTALGFAWQECESNGIGPDNHYPPPVLGGSGYVIYPDYGGDAALRAAHQDHIHMQVGPTRS